MKLLSCLVMLPSLGYATPHYSSYYSKYNNHEKSEELASAQETCHSLGLSGRSYHSCVHKFQNLETQVQQSKSEAEQLKKQLSSQEQLTKIAERAIEIINQSAEKEIKVFREDNIKLQAKVSVYENLQQGVDIGQFDRKLVESIVGSIYTLAVNKTKPRADGRQFQEQKLPSKEQTSATATFADADAEAVASKPKTTHSEGNLEFDFEAAYQNQQQQASENRNHINSGDCPTQICHTQIGKNRSGVFYNYTGQVNEYNQAHGFGWRVYENGGFYAGFFENGWMKQGIFATQNNHKYCGEFEKDLKTGVGAYFNADNTLSYAGNYHHHTRHGFGVKFWNNGNVYLGDFHNSQLTGHGKFLWNSGSYFDGEWVNGERSPASIVYYEDIQRVLRDNEVSTHS